MNDIFFLLGSDLHNFADDNTVTAVAETIQNLINSLEVKTSNIIEWMKDNDMIANPNKFKAIVLTKTDHNTAGILGPIHTSCCCRAKPIRRIKLGSSMVAARRMNRA